MKKNNVLTGILLFTGIITSKANFADFTLPTEPPCTIVATASVTANVSCHGGNNGSASASQTGGISPFTYSWTGGGTNSTKTGLTAGSYTITIQDSAGCSSTASVTITQPSLDPAISIFSTTNVNCFGGTGSAVANAALGGTSPYTYHWTPSGGTNLTANSLTAGTYTITATDNHGCTATASTTITQPSAALAITLASHINETCNGESVGSIVANAATGGTSPYTYNWTPSGGTNLTASNLSAGSYSINVTDNHGCTAKASISITQPALLQVNESSLTNVSCFQENDGSITVASSGGTSPYTYSWSPVSSTKSSVTGLSAGSYTVSVTDHHGCAASNSFTITQPSSIPTTGIISQSNVLCFGGTGSITAQAATGGTSPYSYNWTPSGGTNLTASNITAGTYTITATDSHGCTATAFGTITQPANPVSISISSHSDLTCNGNSSGSATASAATGGTSPYSYNWTPSGGTKLTASNLSAGTYTITATDMNGCTGSSAITISQPALLQVSDSSLSNVTCRGLNNGIATVNSSGGTTPYTYLWSPGGGSSKTETGLSAGTYTVMLTDKNSCSSTTSIIITQPALVLAIAISSQTNVLCNGGTGSAIAHPATGGTSPYTYNWTPSGGTNRSASGLSAGLYTITATDNNGCTATASVNITQPTALVISILSKTNVNCNNNSTGTATANAATGGTSPYTYTWIPSGGTNLTASNLSAGTYTIQVKDKNACSATASVSITQPASALAISISSHTNVNCNGNSTGSAIANAATGGTSPYSYNWTPNGGTNLTASNLSAGTYTITSTDNNGCTATNSVAITQPAVLSITISSQTNPTCLVGGKIVASAATGGTSPYTYNWTPSGGSGLTASNLSAGTYTITATDGNGCTARASASLTQPANPIISIATVTNVSCNGGKGSITANLATGGASPYTYKWTPSGGTNLTTTSLSAGTYTITVTDMNGCTGTSSATITQPALLVVSDSNITDISCNGENNGSAIVKVSGGTSPYSYAWTPSGGSNSSAINLTVGSYTITVTDINSCSGTLKITITQPAILRDSMVAASTIEINCNGNSTGAAKAGVKGGTAPYTYSWAPSGVTTANINLLSAGSYKVFVVDNNGCSATSSITLTQPSAISDSLVSMISPTCNGGDNGTATIGVKGGVSPYTYAWSPNVSTTATATGIKANAYTVTVKDNNGCSLRVLFTLTQPLAIRDSIVSGTQVNVSCFGGNNGSGTVGAIFGTTPYTYSWLPSGGTNATASNLSAGSYTVTVTDINGCSGTTKLTITQSPTPLRDSISLISNVSCNGGNNGSLTVGVKGGANPYTYSWAPLAGSKSVLSGLSAGIYSVYVSDKNGCSLTPVSATITQPALLQISDSSQTNLTCNGDNVGSGSVSTIGGVTPYTYVWSPGGETNSSRTGLSAGTYTIKVKDNNGCSSTTSITITQPPALTLSVIPFPVACNGGSSGEADASVSGGTSPYTYLWNPGGSTKNTATGLSTGTYSVTVTDNNGCSKTASTTITQPVLLGVSASVTTQITCSGGNNAIASSTPTGGTTPYTYTWSPGGGSNSTKTGLSAGTYSITVKDLNGCTAVASITVSQPLAIRDSIVAALTTNVSCNGENNGSATVGVKYGTKPYTYNWTPSGGSNATASGLTPGTYTVTVTDKNGCNTSSSVSISQPSVLTDSLVSLDCVQADNATVTITGKGGTSPYTYSWAPDGKTGSTVTGLSNGVYTVTVHDNNGCSSTKSFNIVCDQAPPHQDGNQKNSPACCPVIDEVSLYPNPNSGQFTLAGLESGMTIELYDYSGRRISNMVANDVTMQFNISNQANGIYLIRIISKDGSLVSQKKVVKTN